jgi:hypothetical protein
MVEKEQASKHVDVRFMFSFGFTKALQVTKNQIREEVRFSSQSVFRNTMFLEAFALSQKTIYKNSGGSHVAT